MNTSQNRFAGETGRVLNIPIAQVRALPQVRTQFKEASIAELASSIEAYGLLEPIVVRPDGDGFTVVIGERRLRALQKANAEFAPAIVADIDEDNREEIQLIENIQREDLSVKDLSNSVHKLWKKHRSVPEVARRCGKSKSWVVKRLALAMDVGPLTAQLLDANAKDTEMLYAFATLEKADDRRARALLPDLLEKTKGRKNVQIELQIALGKKAEQQTEPAAESTNLDLFKDNAGPGSLADKNDTSLNVSSEIALMKTSLQIATAALKEIEGFSKAMSPSEKAMNMRRIATAALNKIQGI